MTLLREPLLHFAIAGAVLFGGLCMAARKARRRSGDRTCPHRRRRCPLAEADMVEPVAARAQRRRVEGPGRRSPQGEADGARGRGDGARPGRHHHPPPPGAKAASSLSRTLPSWPSRRSKSCGSSMPQIQPASRRRGNSRSSRSTSIPRTRADAATMPPQRSPGSRRMAEAVPTRAIGCCSATALMTPMSWRCQACSARTLRMKCLRLDAGQWRGPIKSGYGLHLVLVTQRTPTEPKPFETVEGLRS